MSPCRAMGWIVALGAALLAVPARAAPTPNPDRFFETQVRPLLAANCISCHGEKKQKGDLRLDSLSGTLKGGKDGPAVVPGKPAESRLVTAIGYHDPDLQMPPDEQLSADQVEVLTRWVAMGAPWPVTSAKIAAPLAKGKKRTITDEDRQFWSFRPLSVTTPPTAADDHWSRNDVDRFVFAKLRAEGMSPAPEADRATLIRRATFDLTGLPPTPAEVEAFVDDPSSDAYDKLIDRLLASPRYGEHWARHWLDLVRYAESDGYKQDGFRPTAYFYRDYVIKAFNDDKPYDRFVTEQLAGDELAPDDPNVIVATGYFRNGTYEYNQRNVRVQWDTMLADVTDVTADAFLGLSMGCARCHDHKFDPILQSDYYRLQAFFAPMLPRQDVPLATTAERCEYAAKLAEWERQTASIREQIDAIEKPLEKKAADKTIDMFPPEVAAMMRRPRSELSPLEQQLSDLANRQVYEKAEPGMLKPSAADAEKLKALKAQLAEYDAVKPKPLPMGMVITDVGATAPPTVIPGHEGASLEPGYPIVLDKLGLPLPGAEASAASTGRRTALAKWITNPSNPLATRVIANRIWQYHFGRGIVGTSSDFGKLGERPSHPELLDWLARRFVQDGWSFKRMHRLIMTSATYRQVSARPAPEAARMKDPENRWLWRFPVHRLEAEPIRDAMLAVSGELTEAIGGPSVDGNQPRRSIYVKVIRNSHDPLLSAFDAAETFGSVANRNVTTTANQALLMINGAWPLKRATAMARRLAEVGPADSGSVIDAAYRLAYGRPPSPGERAAAAQFLGDATVSGSSQPDPRLIDFCHVLMNSNEFLYVN